MKEEDKEQPKNEAKSGPVFDDDGFEVVTSKKGRRR